MSEQKLLEDLTGIAVSIVKQMKNIIKLNGAFATGNLYNSVKYKVYKDKSEKFHMDIDYVYYGLWIDEILKKNNPHIPNIILVEPVPEFYNHLVKKYEKFCKQREYFY